jgi:hypothetical protein
MVTLEYLKTTAHFSESYTPLPALVLLLSSHLPVLAWLRSMTKLLEMTSAPSDPSEGILIDATAVKAHSPKTKVPISSEMPAIPEWRLDPAVEWCG